MSNQTEAETRAWRANYLRQQALRLETRIRQLQAQAETWREQADSLCQKLPSEDRHTGE